MDQLASHGLFDVTVEAQGDTWIDDHHTNEDIALALGAALAQALGDRRGIHRFGNFTGELGGGGGEGGERRLGGILIDWLLGGVQCWGGGKG